MAETFRLTNASCQEKKDSLVEFMNYQLGHHKIKDKTTHKQCSYDQNTNWCVDFCGYSNQIKNDSHFRLTNMNLNAYRDDEECCPPFLVALMSGSGSD